MQKRMDDIEKFLEEFVNNPKHDILIDRVQRAEMLITNCSDRQALLERKQAACATHQDARLLAEEEARRSEEAEARLLAEEEARRSEKAEARLLAEAEAQLSEEAEARLLAEAEARLRGEEETRLLTEAEVQRELDELMVQFRQEVMNTMLKFVAYRVVPRLHEAPPKMSHANFLTSFEWDCSMHGLHERFCTALRRWIRSIEQAQHRPCCWFKQPKLQELEAKKLQRELEALRASRIEAEFRTDGSARRLF